MDSPALVLGLDGGGTRTRAALCDGRGRLLACGEAGPANARDRGPGPAREALAAAAAAARRGAEGELLATCAGLAGVWTEAERAAARSELLSPFASPGAFVVSDLEVAHAGAFAGGPGLLLVAGTGAACLGRDTAGRLARAGGWGPRIDDAGGAHDLVRHALSVVARAEDGRGPETVLQARLPAALGAGDLRGALRELEGPAGTRARLAALAPLVTAAASEGDAPARALVAAAADELALAARAVAASLDLEAPEIAAVGGLAEAPGLRAALELALAARIPGARTVPARLPPVLGACLLALAQAGFTSQEPVPDPPHAVVLELTRCAAVLTGP